MQRGPSAPMVEQRRADQPHYPAAAACHNHRQQIHQPVDDARVRQMIDGQKEPRIHSLPGAQPLEQLGAQDIQRTLQLRINVALLLGVGRLLIGLLQRLTGLAGTASDLSGSLQQNLGRLLSPQRSNRPLDALHILRRAALFLADVPFCFAFGRSQRRIDGRPRMLRAFDLA